MIILLVRRLMERAGADFEVLERWGVQHQVIGQHSVCQQVLSTTVVPLAPIVPGRYIAWASQRLIQAS
jgi:hypothetical protein